MPAVTLTAPPGTGQRPMALLSRMAAFGVEVVTRLVRIAGDDATPPTISATGVATFLRVTRAVIWAEMLATVFAGTYIPIALRPVSQPEIKPETQPAARASTRRTTTTQRQLPAITSAMHRAFATRPIGQIVEKICAGLGIARGSALWPEDLIAMTETPVEWTASHLARRPPSPPASPSASPLASPLASDVAAPASPPAPSVADTLTPSDPRRAPRQGAP